MSVLSRLKIFLLIIIISLIGGCNYFSPRKINIILITVDTLRADHLNIYGYKRNKSLLLNYLRDNGVVFENAFSQSSWTLPAMTSIFTSLYPSEHGALYGTTKIPSIITTLPEMLKKIGYYNIGITPHTFVSRKYGFANGFDIFDETAILGHNAINSFKITKIASKQLNKIKHHNKFPFFLWIHYFDPHFNYIRHTKYNFSKKFDKTLPDIISSEWINKMKKEKKLTEEKKEYIKDVYDEEISYTLEAIDKLFKLLVSTNLIKNTIIIFTADHGEFLGENEKFFHGKYVNNELIKVPLLIGGKVLSKQRLLSKHCVETRSIAKTIMDLLKIRQHPFKGNNLFSTNKKQYCFSEGTKAFEKTVERSHSYSLIFNKWKLIYNRFPREKSYYKLYKLNNIKGENRNLFRFSDKKIQYVRRTMLRRMKRQLILLSNKKKRIKNSNKISLNEKKLKKLRSLGYTAF